jgi:hypothetical protein
VGELLEGAIGVVYWGGMGTERAERENMLVAFMMCGVVCVS